MRGILFYSYPETTIAICNSDYTRPYENPISVSCGDLVKLKASMETDYIGWGWCTAKDGRSGWVPENWCQVEQDNWRLKRDFTAIELSVSRGDFVRLLYSESGFVFCRMESGQEGWLPDAALTLYEEI